MTQEREAAAEPRNRVLSALALEERARLLPHLEPVAVAPLEVLADAGRPLGHVYFPETAIVSVVRRLRDGSMIETYAVGPKARSASRACSATLARPRAPSWAGCRACAGAWRSRRCGGCSPSCRRCSSWCAG